ncbi:choice-of-anchor L domain-containing protein [Dokdonia sp. R78006]|uniref:T9SS type B sorting domain-containing protein n=4 Tax=Dokdonia TaxID=326319 RepID=UPI0036D2A996
MRVFLLAIILFFSCYNSSSAQSIAVNNPVYPESAFTAEELIQNVLISGSSCADVSLTNFQENPGGATDSNQKSWGYFNANGSNFPFQDGIILTSGFARLAEGPNDDGGGNSAGGWNGDTDLQTILDNLYGTVAVTNDATVFEFTFSSNIDTVDFEFIFASEEYENEFECDDNFRDGFAFLVKGPGIPDDSGTAFGGTNIAAIQGSSNVAVSTATIHLDPTQDAINGFLCGSEDLGVNYFPELYVSNSNDNLNDIPTQFDGLTTVLTTTTVAIVPNETYTLKMVIADRSDNGFDSAVFLRGGSLSLGVDIGADQVGINFNAACEGETITLDATDNTTATTTFEWQQFNTTTSMFESFVPAQVNGTLDVMVDGQYKVLVDTGSGCIGEDSVAIEFASAMYNDPMDIMVCDDPSGDGVEVFNLNDQLAAITSGQTDVMVTFHTLQSDAEMDINNISNPGAYTNTSPSEEIFVRIETMLSSNCFDVGSFVISVSDQTVANDPGPFLVCDDATDGDDTNGITVFDLSSITDTILGVQDPTLFNVSFHSGGVDANNNDNPLPLAYTNSNAGGETIVVRVENNSDVNCFATRNISLVVGELPVLTTPVTLRQCDDDTNGVTTLNLTQSQSELSTNSANETFTYVDASGTPITDPTAYINSGSPFNEAIAVTVTNLDGCSREGVINLIVSASQIPTGTFFADEIECDTDGDGIAVFDFSGATATIETFFSPQVVSVAYYETEQEALSEINPIIDTAAYSNNPLFTSAGGVQDIWVRVEADTDNGCVGLGEHVRLTVTPNPTFLPTISSIETCSAVANAATFDLTQNVAEITGGDSDLEVTFYESIAAYTATPPVAIASPTSFSNSSNPQTIFYSLRSTSSTCTTFDTAMNFETIVNQNPVAITPSELQVCDEDGVVDGFTTVDLSQKDAEITSGFNANLTVTYHLDAAGATTGDASIPDSTMFTTTSNPQIVGVRVTNNTTGCFSTTSMSIRSFPVPVAVTPADYEACDDDNDGVFDFFVLSSRDTEITGGDPSLSVAYYLTQADADNAPVGQELDAAMYINNDPFEQIIFARVFNAIGCYDTTPLTLRVLNTPMPNENATPFALCDDNSDGLQIFDLSTQVVNILGGLDPATHSVVWFSSLASAEAGTPAIATPSAYTSNTATVFAVVTDTAQPTTTATFCSNIATLSLVVNPLPTPVQPAEYELCDDLESGSDTDEFASFDLRSRDDEITGGNDDWAVSYHLTQGDADAGAPALPDVYQNTVMANQTIFARVENIVTSCFETTTLTLVVNPLPSPTTIVAVEECDTMANDGDVDNDGDAVFDLTGQVTADIINGETFMSLTFHETLASAELGSPSIATPAAYETVSRTIFVRATDTDPATATQCYRVIELELIVQPAPVLPAVIPDLTSCDDNEDGQALFDLTQNDAIVLGTQTTADVTLTYHETLASAEAMVGSVSDMPVADPLNYLASAPTTPIWVRLENTTTGCTVVGTFNLNIAMIPAITPPGVFEECDSEGALVGTDTDGITSFDLTSLDTLITGGDTTLSVSYYESQADLDAGTTNAISTPTAYVNTGMSPQTIFILVTSDQAGMCGAQTTVDLQVNPLPVIGEPLPAAVACDEDNDGFGAFDLQQYNDDLLATVTNIDLRFYETLDNATADTGAGQIDITLPYNNISGMTSLYVVAQDTDATTATSCTKIYEFELIVFPIPELPTTLATLAACDDNNDLMEVIDLTQNESTIIGTQDPATLIITYHNTQADADLGINPIVNPTAYTATQIAPLEIIWVRLQVSDGSPNICAAIGSFEISVETPPTANPNGDDLDLMICDDDTDTFTEFDLSVNQASLTGGDPLLTVTYYESLAALNAGTPITDPSAYTNILNPQTIQAVVSSPAGCSDGTTFNIEVLPLPTPNTNPDALEVCDTTTDIDTDGDGVIDAGSGSATDGFEVFDLTPAIAQIAGAEPVNITVYTELAFAEANPEDTTLAITDVTAFINTVTGNQTLYARVERDVPGNSDLDSDGNLCFVVVPFEVVVNPLPILAAAGPVDYTFCEEFDGDDAMGSVDLTTLADLAGLLAAPQVTSDFIITYHELEVQATANAAALSSPYTVADNQELFVRIENATTGCVNFTSIIFTVESRPEVFPADNIVQCADDFGVNIAPEQSTATFDLTQQNAVITGNVAATSVSYYTSLADAQAMTSAIATPSAFENITNPQVIYARAVNTASSCESSTVVDFEIFVQPLPYTNLTQEGGQICVDEITGEALNPFTIDGTVESPQIGVTYSYVWTRDGALVSLNPEVTIDAAGTYQVMITATYGDGTSCDYVAEAVYSAESAPVFEAVVVESSFNNSGLYTVEVINVTGADVASAYEFAIDDGPFQSSTTFTGVTPGTHTVFGRLASGNCSISEVEIGIIDYPRFFTPNADGFHDTWNIIGLGVAPNLNAKIFIFDRYGKLLKQISPVGAGWDGTFNGQPMPSSDYWFRVEFTEVDELGTQRTVNGHFTLKR